MYGLGSLKHTSVSFWEGGWSSAGLVLGWVAPMGRLGRPNRWATDHCSLGSPRSCSLGPVRSQPCSLGPVTQPCSLCLWQVTHSSAGTQVARRTLGASGVRSFRVFGCVSTELSVSADGAPTTRGSLCITPGTRPRPLLEPRGNLTTTNYYSHSCTHTQRSAQCGDSSPSVLPRLDGAARRLWWGAVDADDVGSGRSPTHQSRSPTTESNNSESFHRSPPRRTLPSPPPNPPVPPTESSRPPTPSPPVLSPQAPPKGAKHTAPATGW